MSDDCSSSDGVDDSNHNPTAYRLAHMNPFDATHFAALAALDPNARIRRELAEALAQPFRLVGDGFILAQLTADSDRAVRTAALRASRARGYRR